MPPARLADPYHSSLPIATIYLSLAGENLARVVPLWRPANRLNCARRPDGGSADYTRRWSCPTSAGFGTCEQILNGFADLHELIQARRLGDELGNPQVVE